MAKKIPRGKEWQDLLERQFPYWQATGLGSCIVTPPQVKRIRPLFGGQFVGMMTSGGPPDFVVRTRDHAFLADAKDCISDKFPLKNLHQHQADSFDRWDEVSGYSCSFLIIRHQASDRSFVVPYSEIRNKFTRWSMLKSKGERAPHGSASLSLQEIELAGVEFWNTPVKKPEFGWLLAAIILAETAKDKV